MISNVYGYDDDIKWSCAIKISSSDGAGNEIVFGEATDASNGEDPHDAPAPPFPPTLPNINARFLTQLEDLYSELLHEYKEYPSFENQWNLSIVWLPEPLSGEFENESLTTVTLSWNISDLRASEYSSIILMKDNLIVEDMLINGSYSFSTNGNTPNFYNIKCQSGDIVNNSDMNGNNEKNETESTPSFLFIELVIISLLISMVILKKQKNN